MDGDDLCPGPHLKTTRAVTVDAVPEDIWPWLVLEPAGPGHTRLITRLRSRYDWGKAAIVTELILMELGDPS